MTPYVVISLPRSGTTLLMSSMIQHDNISVYRYWELFGWRRFAWLNFIDWDKTQFTGHETAKSLFKLYPHGVFGFKIFNDDINKTNTVWEYLKQHKEIKIIHMIRNNYLDRIVSYRKAKKTMEWQVAIEQNKQPQQIPSFNISSKMLDIWFDEDESTYYKYNKMFSGHDKIEIEYDTYVNHYDSTMNTVFDFLGVNSIKCIPRLIKQGIPASQQLSNYQELRSYYSRTKYSRFFNYTSLF